MDVLRRNTDYALRAVMQLARCWRQEPISARQMACEGKFSYQFACKILQKLHNARLVESCMGPKGGFRLSRGPSKISLLEVIGAIQGPVSLNKCLLSVDVCPFEPKCAVSEKLAELQEYIDGYLHNITLDELLKSRRSKRKPTIKGKSLKGRRK